MPKFPSVTGRQSMEALKRLGFIQVGVNGSHHIMKHPDRPGTASVPVHGNESLQVGTMTGILALANVSKEDFIEALDKKKFKKKEKDREDR